VKNIWGSGAIPPHIINLGNRSRWVVSFTSRPLYSGEKSRPSWRFRKRNSSSVLGTEPRSVGRPARSLVTILTPHNPPIRSTLWVWHDSEHQVVCTESLGNALSRQISPPLDCPQTLTGTPLPPRGKRSHTSNHSTGRLCYWIPSCICPIPQDPRKLYCSLTNMSWPLTPQALTDRFL
jgi:hypothetical protein